MTEQMTAVRFHGPKDIRVEQVDRPALQNKGDVKINIGAAGICGSDLHVYETGAYVTKLPVIMGHEFAGTILEVGSKVGGLAPGDHVVGDSRVTCGQCEYCNRGLPNLCDNIGFLGEVCDGAFAEEVVVDQSLLVKIHPDVPFHLAALAEPLAVALHAVSRVEIDKSSRILVLGAGPIGALIHCLLKIKGFNEAYIADISEYRCRTIQRRFPESVVDPSGEYDHVFETTGSTKVLKDTVPNVLRKKGALTLVGLFGAPAEFDFTQVVEMEWTVHGCAAFSSELPEAAKALEKHWSKFEHIVRHLLSLSEGQTAFDILLNPSKEAMKIVFTQ